LIEAAGGCPIAFPAIRIAPPEDPSRAMRLLAAPADLIVFVSRNAVQRSLSLFPGSRLPATPRLAAIGRSTARALQEAGRFPDLVPERRWDSETLLAHPALQDMTGQRVVIVRGEGGRPLLGDSLAKRGADLRYAEVYRRSLPRVDPAILLERWRQDVQAVTATSGEILDNLLALLGEPGRPLLLSTRLVVVSERTRDAALALGFHRVELADNADDRSLVLALCRALRDDRES
jgi:uroporphyrinogen-III synthase